MFLKWIRRTCQELFRLFSRLHSRLAKLTHFGKPNGPDLARTGFPERCLSPRYFPVHLKRVFTQFRMRPSEKVADCEAHQRVALRQGQPPVRLYFDQQSGLLLRLVRFAEIPVDRLPTQIDYADYRDADGVKVPFRWTLARPGGRLHSG